MNYKKVENSAKLKTRKRSVYGPLRTKKLFCGANIVETRGIEPLSGTESSGTSPGAVSV